MDTITRKELDTFREKLYQEEKSAATIEKYLRDVRAFVCFTAGRPMSKELTLAYKRALVEQGYSIRSINSMLAAVNTFLDFICMPECRVKSMRRQREIFCPENRELSREEYMRLLETSRAGKKWQLNLLMQTICATGIRVSELKYFTVEAVRQGQISVRCKNKTRTIFVPVKLKKALLSFAKQRKIHSGCIFVTRKGNPLDRSNIWHQMKMLCEKAGVNPAKVFPHNLRKLFARTFYALEKDIAKLADILGHASIETTRIYIMATGSEHRRKIERMQLLL